MTYQAPGTRTFTLRAKRETVLLVATAGALTFALSSVVHSHRPAGRAEAMTQQAWAGELAEVTPQQEVAAAAVTPITSASLVVPKAELALPQAPVRALVRLHGCDGSLCGAHLSTAPVPPPRRVAISEGFQVPQAIHAVSLGSHRDKPGLIARLNPLNHLPDGATLKRPFSVASDTVAGWFKRF